MGLFSSFLRQQDPRRQPRDAVPQDAASAELLRVRARRRLIGAAVLVSVAVIALPIFFESQPRPLDSDIAIDLPRKTVASAAGGSAATHSASAARIQPPAPTVGAGGAAEAPAPATVGGAEAGALASPQAALPPIEPAESKPPHAVNPVASLPAAKVAQDSAAAERAAAAAAEKAARDKALRAERLAAEKAAAEHAAAMAKAAADKALASRKAESTARFVVQVGAFAEAATVREARQRIEKLGLRASEQEIETANGRRTRVRLGPFNTREEADRALARLRAAGLPGAVLTL
jgi:DedD protein